MNRCEALGSSRSRRGLRENMCIDVGLSIPDRIISATLDALPCEFRHKAAGLHLQCLIFVSEKQYRFVVGQRKPSATVRPLPGLTQDFPDDLAQVGEGEPSSKRQMKMEPSAPFSFDRRACPISGFCCPEGSWYGVADDKNYQDVDFSLICGRIATRSAAADSTKI